MLLLDRLFCLFYSLPVVSFLWPASLSSPQFIQHACLFLFSLNKSVCSVGSPVPVHYPTSLHNDPRVLPEPVASLRASHCSPVFYLLDNGKRRDDTPCSALSTDTCLWLFLCDDTRSQEFFFFFLLLVVSTLHPACCLCFHTVSNTISKTPLILGTCFSTGRVFLGYVQPDKFWKGPRWNNQLLFKKT